MKILRATAILIVDRIEDQLSFYEQMRGDTQVVVVPHGDVAGFAILERDGLEVMSRHVRASRMTCPPCWSG